MGGETESEWGSILPEPPSSLESELFHAQVSAPHSDLESRVCSLTPDPWVALTSLWHKHSHPWRSWMRLTNKSLFACIFQREKERGEKGEGKNEEQELQRSKYLSNFKTFFLYF